jgi:hypothetical protein
MQMPIDVISKATFTIKKLHRNDKMSQLIICYVEQLVLKAVLIILYSYKWCQVLIFKFVKVYNLSKDAQNVLNQKTL